MVEDVYLAGTTRELVPHHELDRLETTLGSNCRGITGPLRHNLGMGWYCNSFQFYEPQRVLADTTMWRETWSSPDAWYFDHPTLNSESIQQCVYLGVAVSGDQFFFSPEQESFHFKGCSFLELIDAGSNFADASLSFAQRYLGHDLQKRFHIPAREDPPFMGFLFADVEDETP